MVLDVESNATHPPTLVGGMAARGRVRAAMRELCAAIGGARGDVRRPTPDQARAHADEVAACLQLSEAALGADAPESVLLRRALVFAELDAALQQSRRGGPRPTRAVMDALQRLAQPLDPGDPGRLAATLADLLWRDAAGGTAEPAKAAAAAHHAISSVARSGVAAIDARVAAMQAAALLARNQLLCNAGDSDEALDVAREAADMAEEAAVDIAAAEPLHSAFLRLSAPPFGAEDATETVCSSLYNAGAACERSGRSTRARIYFARALDAALSRCGGDKRLVALCRDALGSDHSQHATSRANVVPAAAGLASPAGTPQRSEAGLAGEPAQQPSVPYPRGRPSEASESAHSAESPPESARSAAMALALREAEDAAKELGTGELMHLQGLGASVPSLPLGGAAATRRLQRRRASAAPAAPRASPPRRERRGEGLLDAHAAMDGPSVGGNGFSAARGIAARGKARRGARARSGHHGRLGLVGNGHSATMESLPAGGAPAAGRSAGAAMVDARRAFAPGPVGGAGPRRRQGGRTMGGRGSASTRTLDLAESRPQLPPHWHSAPRLSPPTRARNHGGVGQGTAAAGRRARSGTRGVANGSDPALDPAPRPRASGAASPPPPLRPATAPCSREASLLRYPLRSQATREELELEAGRESLRTRLRGTYEDDHRAAVLRQRLSEERTHAADVAAGVIARFVLRATARAALARARQDRVRVGRGAQDAAEARRWAEEYVRRQRQAAAAATVLQRHARGVLARRWCRQLRRRRQRRAQRQGDEGQEEETEGTPGRGGEERTSVPLAQQRRKWPTSAPRIRAQGGEGRGGGVGAAALRIPTPAADTVGDDATQPPPGVIAAGTAVLAVSQGWEGGGTGANTSGSHAVAPAVVAWTRHWSRGVIDTAVHRVARAATSPPPPQQEDGESEPKSSAAFQPQPQPQPQLPPQSEPRSQTQPQPGNQSAGQQQERPPALQRHYSSAEQEVVPGHQSSVPVVAGGGWRSQAAGPEKQGLVSVGVPSDGKASSYSEHRASEHDAARRIQALWRGFAARRAFDAELSARSRAESNSFHHESSTSTTEPPSLEVAAVHIQSCWRGALARRRFLHLLKEAEEQVLREHNAARLVQAQWRGFVQRHAFVKRLDHEVATALRQSEDARTMAPARAAVVIQACWRGFMDRQRFDKLLAEKEDESLSSDEMQSWGGSELRGVEDPGEVVAQRGPRTDPVKSGDRHHHIFRGGSFELRIPHV